MFKHLSRIALMVLVASALGLGTTALAGSASAAWSTTACSGQHTQVHQAQKHVRKDQSSLRNAKRHHHKAAAKVARKRLARDRAKLAQARHDYRACLNPGATPAPAPSPSPAPGAAPAPAPAPAPNPVTEQCLAAAGLLAAQDQTGQLSQVCTGLGALPV